MFIVNEKMYDYLWYCKLFVEFSSDKYNPIFDMKTNVGADGLRNHRIKRQITNTENVVEFLMAADLRVYEL